MKSIKGKTMNSDNIEKANQLLSESQKLYKKGIDALNAGEDPKEVRKKYADEAGEKLDRGMELLWG
ncbi:hypothetical protein [Draconibacterium halophilum]|uniref:Uncharacterized protein n=1 Tax=Draconibacterium halophilum TaxID=2706887 RepID=A0A6C0R7X9_9BACT|nr:hypothetical protein [Draconibacterium halophilum]QIA06428.1 hypothetical protein G0Q07_01200 [Draconibacterium halophilum]